MTRIAIIGNGGGGKSTLAVALGRSLGLPVHHIDRIQFQPGWRQTPEHEVAAAHAALLRNDRWVIDGWGPWATIEERFHHADTIVIVDFALRRHLFWALKRQLMHPFGSTPDRPALCPLLPMTWRMFKTICHVHAVLRPRLLALAAEHRPSKRVVHLRSPRELAGFRAEHGPGGTT